jgi:hypothetical protein
VKSLTSTAFPIDEAQDVVAKRNPGGQPGNTNCFKSGRFSKRNCALRSDIAGLKRAIRETLVLAEAALKARGR